MENMLASCYRFIEVSGGEDGIFYDAVHATKEKEHIDDLVEEGYCAKVVNRKNVPPCCFRYFAVSLDSYTDETWKSGAEFYFND